LTVIFKAGSGTKLRKTGRGKAEKENAAVKKYVEDNPDVTTEKRMTTFADERLKVLSAHTEASEIA
jgi:hypothetical protein